MKKRVHVAVASNTSSLWGLENDRTARVLLLSSAFVCRGSLSPRAGYCGVIDDGKFDAGPRFSEEGV